MSHTRVHKNEKYSALEFLFLFRQHLRRHHPLPPPPPPLPGFALSGQCVFTHVDMLGACLFRLRAVAQFSLKASCSGSLTSTLRGASGTIYIYLLQLAIAIVLASSLHRDPFHLAKTKSTDKFFFSPPRHV